jgi:long-chain fatty acid transport protein
VSNVETPSQIYFSQKISDRIAWGIGINNPFGLATEWKDVPLTLSSKRAELVTYLINPNIAFRMNKYFSLALGLDYLSAEVKEFSRDLLAPVTTANLTGEGDGFGYNAALSFKMDHVSVAAQYRSGFTPNIQGNLAFSGPPGNVLNSSASAKIDLPSEAMLGVAWTSRRVDVELDADYTAWNVFKSLDIVTPSPLTSVSQTENWAATWAYRLGVAVRIDKEGHHELRAGGVWDDTPIPTQYLRPSIPDADRTGYSLGYGWQGKHFGVDVYGMELQFDDVTANGSPVDGVIPGTYQTSILLFGGTFKYRF